MDITKITPEIAAVHGAPGEISNVDFVLDLFSLTYGTSYQKLLIKKELFPEEFFKLSTGLAGEILQKFINYAFTIAIAGDFSGYTSKPLHDFIRECNRGRNVFFAATEEEAIAMLETV